MELGVKLKNLRLKKGLTQEELASRCELTKGYISQLENDLTSPSIVTLNDILIVLGTGLSEFFVDDDERLVFKKEDCFVKEGESTNVVWLVPTAQKNSMEPIKMEIKPGAQTEPDMPHEGEEFGYVIKGRIKLYIGKREETAEEGESFYYHADRTHYIENIGDDNAIIIWLSCPPNF